MPAIVGFPDLTEKVNTFIELEKKQQPYRYFSMGKYDSDAIVDQAGKSFWQRKLRNGKLKHLPR